MYKKRVLKKTSGYSLKLPQAHEKCAMKMKVEEEEEERKKNNYCVKIFVVKGRTL